MPDDPYSLADLARLADVTPRTIRYYVAQGLLPSPDAAGPATRYGEGHLQRLRLIRRLQRDHLPLSEIRGRLERMADDDVVAALDATGVSTVEPPIDTDQTVAYVRGLMASAGIEPRFHDAVTGPTRMLRVRATLDRPIPDGFPIREQPGPAPSPGPSPTPAPVPAPSPEPGFRPAPPPSSPIVPAIVPTPDSGPDKRPLLADRTTWERLSITPDVEIHVRRPLDRLTNKRVERLARIARELFEEE